MAHLNGLRNFAEAVGESAKTISESAEAAEVTVVPGEPWPAARDELRKRYPFVAELGVFEVEGGGENPQVDAAMLQALEELHKKAKMAELGADWEVDF